MAELFDVGTGGAQVLPLASGDDEIQVFDIKVLGTRDVQWRSLFEGFRNLKVITFGSERVLSHEIAALEQATTAAGYRFTDALADQKAFIERFVRPALSKRGEQLLERVQDKSLRFRLLRKLPSHAKLYLLSGDDRFRVVAQGPPTSASRR